MFDSKRESIKNAAGPYRSIFTADRTNWARAASRRYRKRRLRFLKSCLCRRLRQAPTDVACIQKRAARCERPNSRLIFVLCWASLLPTCFVGCSKESTTAIESTRRSGKPIVYTVNYPLAYFASRIGGDSIEVLFPVPEAVDPIHWTPDAFADFQSADLILLNGAGYAKWTQQSIPVASPMPRYLKSGGDAEQFYDPLFREIDTGGTPHADTADGVASWLEIFALGGYGAGRRQIQLLNLYDSCCFSGDGFLTYKDFVSDQVDSLGTGNWDFVSDTSHSQHLISSWAIEHVISPALDQ
jgi:hypothetical protein